MDRRAFLASTAAVGAAGVAGCAVGGRGDGASGSTDGADHDVGMTTRRFRPATITVEPGTTVAWKNTSSHGHTVTAYDDRIPDDGAFFASGGFDSTEAAEEGWYDGMEGALSQGDTYEHTFEVAGEFAYYCVPHEASGMAGTVVVSEDATVTGE